MYGRLILGNIIKKRVDYIGPQVLICSESRKLRKTGNFKGLCKRHQPMRGRREVACLYTQLNLLIKQTLNNLSIAQLEASLPNRYSGRAEGL